MNNNSKKVMSASSNGDWSKKEQELIETIKKCQKETTARVMTTGECCDKLIKMNQGIQYGDRTLKRIANYSNINCSEYHLRRCWNFYRLMNNNDYVNADLETLSKTPSAIYQLARIMNSPLLSEEKKISLVKEIAKKAVDDGMLVDHVAIEVSMKLHAEENKGNEQEKPDKPQKKVEIINGKQLEQVANSIQKAVRSPQLLKEVMGNKGVCKRILYLMNESIDFIEKMPDYCHDKEISKAITDLLQRLLPIVDKLKGVEQKVA